MPSKVIQEYDGFSLKVTRKENCNTTHIRMVTITGFSVRVVLLPELSEVFGIYIN